MLCMEGRYEKKSNDKRVTQEGKQSDSITDAVARAQGCLLGQIVGDALGSLVEFQTPEQIRQKYPDGVRELADGGYLNTIAGQPTDDSEMALLLARMLVDKGRYNPEEARKAYVFWLDSKPFDCGITIADALQGGWHNPDSQANGAMMRISPLGIFGAKHDLEDVAEWARQDARITHINPVCQQANALFTMAIAYAVRHGCGARSLYEQIVAWAIDKVEENLFDVIQGAATEPPTDYVHQQGWVLIAFRNALWQLLHAPNLEEGVVDTVMRGGDTDTNAAICGALLGAVYGRNAIPAQWTECILNCRPAEGQPNVQRPRPECFWPVDALELAERLVGTDC